MMRGADLLVQALVAAGVSRIFSLSGNQIMALYDACLDAGIEIVHTRHEAAAVFMADAYAQLTGKVGVCLVTAAPGAANALGPLFSAQQAESPVVFLTGDSPIGQDGKGAFQELDQVSMTAPLTKLSFRSHSATELGTDMSRAIHVANSGRPGPVHVALPVDVLEGDAAGGVLPNQSEYTRAYRPLQNDHAAIVLAALAAAKKPLVLCGPVLSATRSGRVLTQLAEAIEAPVVTLESPRGLNDPSLGDFAQALVCADVVLCLGKPVNFTLDFGDQSICGPDCQWYVIDAGAEERKRARLNLGDALVLSSDADPRDAVVDLTQAAHTDSAIDLVNAAHTDVVVDLIEADQAQVTVDVTETRQAKDPRASWRSGVTRLIAARHYVIGVAPAGGGKITPAMLCAAVQRQIEKSADSVVICDGGEFGQWAQAGTRAVKRIINGPSGAIGGSLCYAIAAKKAKPESTVFALMGDGTIGFHFAEFETAVRENTPFVVIVGNDKRWNAEHLIQLREYGPDRLHACNLSDARYDLAAAAFGGYGEYVSDFGELDAALARAVDSGKAACVNVLIEGLPAPGCAIV